MTTTEQATPVRELSRWRRWANPRFVRASLASGLLGGICCLGAAIATAAGFGAAGLLTTVMDRYQLYFIVASIAVMGFWLVRQLRRRGVSLVNLRTAARAVGRHALVMGAVYLITLGIAMGVAQLVTM